MTVGGLPKLIESFFSHFGNSNTRRSQVFEKQIKNDLERQGISLATTSSSWCKFRLGLG